MSSGSDHSALWVGRFNSDNAEREYIHRLAVADALSTAVSERQLERQREFGSPAHLDSPKYSLLGNNNNYDFTRPGAEDGLPLPAFDKVLPRNHRDVTHINRSVNTAESVIREEKLWIPLMKAIQVSIDYAYECEKSNLDNLVSVLMLTNLPVALFMMLGKKQRRIPRQLSEESILSVMRSSAPEINWQRASGGFYSNGLHGGKSFTMMYSDGVNGPTALGVPTVMVSFPGMDALGAQDWINVGSGYARELPGTGIMAHAGFVESALSVEAQLEAFLDTLNLTPGAYQIVFCGHSMGGAVASLCAINYAHKHPVHGQNNVHVYTMGQPKTIKDGHAEAVNALIPAHNNVRFLAFSQSVSYPPDFPESMKVNPQSDSVGGVLDSPVDTIGCCHAGTEYILVSNITLSYVYLPCNRLLLHPLSVYWSAMQSEARGRFDDAAVSYHHTNSFVEEHPTAGPPTNAAGGSVGLFPIPSTGPPLGSDAPSVICAPCSDAHIVVDQNLEYQNQTSCSWPVWGCCASPFVDQPGCVRGVPTLHTGVWDGTGDFWTCCQAAGAGLRYGPGCSVPFAKQVVKDFQVRYKSATAAYSAQLLKCHQLTFALSQLEYASGSSSNAEQARCALSHIELNNLMKQVQAAESSLNEAWYSSGRASFLSEIQPNFGERTTQSKSLGTMSSNIASKVGSAENVDSFNRAEIILHLKALVLALKAALERAQAEAAEASAELASARSCAAKCSATLAASQKNFKNARMASRVAAFEASSYADSEVKFANQNLLRSGEKVSKAQKLYDSAVNDLNRWV